MAALNENLSAALEERNPSYGVHALVETARALFEASCDGVWEWDKDPDQDEYEAALDAAESAIEAFVLALCATHQSAYADVRGFSMQPEEKD